MPVPQSGSMWIVQARCVGCWALEEGKTLGWCREGEEGNKWMGKSGIEAVGTAAFCSTARFVQAECVFLSGLPKHVAQEPGF